MHFLFGIALLAGLIGFAFGENAARAFVGVLLGLGALAILGLLTAAVVDINRQDAAYVQVQR